ncbi:MAG: ribonuclease HII [Flavobacteriales bacterium]
MKTLLFQMYEAPLEAGCDEAGRGCLAGPVVAASVILTRPILGINDSKKLRSTKRVALVEEIKQSALAYSISFVDAQRIDEINILNASLEAMKKAILGLSVRPSHVLIDGNRFNPIQGLNHTCVVGGDGKYQSIAAASILAKTARDEFMKKAAKAFPYYGWEDNMGYPTQKHLKALQSQGVSPYHRRTFGPVSLVLDQRERINANEIE